MNNNKKYILMSTLPVSYISKSDTHLGYWWTLLLSGLFLFLAGALVFQYPIGDYLAISDLFGLVMIVFALMHLVFIIANRAILPAWPWQVLLSFTDIGLGLLLVFYPGIPIRYMPVFMGAWFFMRGISMVSYSLNLRQLMFQGWGWILTTGVLTILLALFVVYNPVFGFFTIIIWTSFSFMLTGLFIMYLSLKIRKGRDEMESIIL